jgi:regulator of replication initiation timing
MASGLGSSVTNKVVEYQWDDLRKLQEEKQDLSQKVSDRDSKISALTKKVASLAQENAALKDETKKRRKGLTPKTLTYAKTKNQEPTKLNEIKAKHFIRTQHLCLC